MPTEVEAPAKDKTCKITIVTPGSSDKVIKLFPAEHEAEIVWTNNTKGIERWEAIKRLMNNHAPRGGRIPEPVAYCKFPDLRTIVIKEQDIPTVTLEGGAFLNKPEDEGHNPDVHIKLNPSVENLQYRMTKMEESLQHIATTLSHLSTRQIPEAYQPVSDTTTAKKALVQETAPPSVPVVVKGTDGKKCFTCGKYVKNEHALSIHKGIFHKNV